MKIIAIVNNKGGVGKTTVSRFVTDYFSLVKKERVLAIDLDPQANFSNRYLKMEIDPYQQEGKMPPVHPNYDSANPDDQDWDGRSSIAGIFFGEAVYPYPTQTEYLEVVPAHSSRLLMAETIRKEEVVQKVYEQLSKFLSVDEVKNSYDKIIIDTPPSKGPLTISCMRACTDIIIPSVMEYQPMEGLYGMVHLWKSETMRRPQNNPLNLIGVLPNAHSSRNTLYRDLLNSLKEQMPEYVLDSVIARRVIYAETDTKDAVPPSIFMYPDSNIAKQEVLKACREIEERMNTHVN